MASKAVKHPRPSSLAPVAIVVSRYNASITDALLAGAIGAYVRAGGKERDVTIVDAPGSYELIALSHAAAKARGVAGVVALGCIIKGETIHDAVIAHAVAQGLAMVMVRTEKPIALGVLTVDTPEQAHARAGGDKGNKGAEAMEALLATLAAARRLRGGSVASGGVRAVPRPDKARRSAR